MRSLYLRIWLTVVAALALFAGVSGWLVQRHLDSERAQAHAEVAQRLDVWVQLIQHSLPPPDADLAEQQQAVQQWSRRLHLPLALDDPDGHRLAVSDSFVWRQHRGAGPQDAEAIALTDGRRLWVMTHRRVGERGAGEPPPTAGPADAPPDWRPDRRPVLRGLPPFFPRDWPAGLGLAALLLVLLLAVAAGAYPVVRRLTRRLERLKQGVETFGAGALGHRVDDSGHDEVAAVAASFNRAAAQIQALVTSNQRLLANASHELRSPLARLKMAVALLDGASPASHAQLSAEIHTNIAELDALVEEVLLSSRLEAGVAVDLSDTVDVLGLVVEEAARVGAQAEGEPLLLRGSDRLLRRALRNLLENAKRYGGDPVQAGVGHGPAGAVLITVSDRGPGVPEAEQQRIFEPFYRLSGHAEREGGVGLGLALVQQIAHCHGGVARCGTRPGGGTVFTLELPAQPTDPATDQPERRARSA